MLHSVHCGLEPRSAGQSKEVEAAQEAKGHHGSSDEAGAIGYEAGKIRTRCAICFGDVASERNGYDGSVLYRNAANRIVRSVGSDG